nr:reverse transcriptase domain-containing protein [Tanacetum cinerariifolium]
MPMYRTATVDVVSNDEELRLNLDLLEEWHERAAIREAKAKSKMTEYYNARVHGVTFRPGDFFYRSNDASHAVAGGKLGPKWEGPYELLRRKTYGYDMFFGGDGSNNDINVLYQSPLFNDLKTGRAPEILFVANGVTYPWGYNLVDEIYPELVTLDKTILEPAGDDNKRILYKIKQ